MKISDKFFYINIRDFLALGNDNEAGEPMLDRVLSGFFCPKNPDVERFLKKVLYDTRQTTSGTVESNELVQLLRLL